MQITSGAVLSGGITFTTPPDIVRSGLIAFLDPGNTASYSGSGTTITDLSGQGATGTINGSITFVNDSDRSYFSFTSSDTTYISSSLAQGYVDFSIAFRPDFSLNNNASSAIVGLLSNNTNGSRADKSVRFDAANGTGPWQIKNPGDGNDWASTGAATTYYLNGTALSGANPSILNSWCVLGGYKTSGSFGSTWSYYLGASGWPGRGFQGRLGAVLLYNKQLTAAEQRQNYEALRGRYNL